MAEYADREHFIPLRKSDLIELLLKDKRLTPQEREPFRQFCKLASCVFHYEYLGELEQLKDAYAPFDPDADTTPLAPLSPEEKGKQREQLFAAFDHLLQRGNFLHLTHEQVEKAVKERGEKFGLETDVDLGMFERLEVYVRGDTKMKRSRRVWRKGWLKEEYYVPIYQRLVVILKLRPHRRLDKEINTEVVYLKIFKNIPKTNQEMLLPGARPLLTNLDRWLIIGPLAVGIGLALFKIAEDSNIMREGTAALLSRPVMWAVAGALGGYGYKSYHSYQVKKQNYSLRLTKSLYYQNLDNNTGVLMRLLDEAEEQECRETFLAYFCLWKYAPPQGWTAPLLDDYVELYLEGNANLKVDFEIGDALAKLERLHLVKKDGEFYHAVPLEKALEMLDYTWDNYFKYNNPEYEAPPVV
jgi:hypothetical protein